MPSRVLLVDDDTLLADVVANALQQESFDVIHCASPDEALDWLRVDRPDAMLLDVDLKARMNGFQLCNLLRRGGWTGDYTLPALSRAIPIMMLTSLGEVDHMLQGYEFGADDYMPKPFNVPLLIARLNVMLRRSDELDEQRTRMQFRSLVIYEDEQKAFVHQQPLELTPTEFDLLTYLANNAGVVQSRATLLREVWGFEDDGSTRVLDMCVRRIRKKLAETDCHDLITTKHRVGYYINS